MTLDDLLVSYKQVRIPKAKPIEMEEPSRFDLFRQSREQEQSSTQQQDEEFQFPGWLETTFQPGQIIQRQSPKEWSEVQKSLIKAYQDAGITNQRAIKMLLAQDAHESGWGKSTQGAYNYGNITASSNWKGDSIDGKDKDENGNTISQRFRSYSSIDDYVADKVKLLKNLYDFNQDDDLGTFIKKLTGENHARKKYAVDKDYGVKIRNLFQSINV